MQGGRAISRAVDLATTPLYVRAGAIVPFGPLKQYTGEQVDGPLELVVYPGANGEGSVYEDDGISLGYQRGDAMRILTSWDDAGRTLSLRLADGSQLRQPMPRRIMVRVAAEGAAREVVFDGTPMQVRF